MLWLFRGLFVVDCVNRDSVRRTSKQTLSGKIIDGDSRLHATPASVYIYMILVILIRENPTSPHFLSRSLFFSYKKGSIHFYARLKNEYLKCRRKMRYTCATRKVCFRREIYRRVKRPFVTFTATFRQVGVKF